jgi:predicted regulator of Ras-like GTPase activity (Roadblock/LC7/MglB family)
MFGFLKTFLRKPVETPAATEELPASNYNTATEAPAAPSSSFPAPRPVAARKNGPAQNGAPQNGGHQNGKGVEIPLQPVIDTLPLELQPRVVQRDAGGATIYVALEKILSQLSRGAVKISFADLKQLAPEFFSHESDRDRLLVPLPLGEILSRLNPALITRRRVQKHIEVPAEISSPFDPKNQGLIFSVGPTKPGLAPSNPAPAPASPRQTAPMRPMPAATPRNTIPSAPTPPPAASQPRSLPAAKPLPMAPPQPLPMPAAKPLPMTPSQPLPMPSAPPRSAITSAPTPPPPASQPLPGPSVISNQRPIRLMPEKPQVEPPSAVAVPAAPAPAPAPPVKEVPPLMVGLIPLAETWPEPVRKEIVQLNLMDAKVALPGDLVEQALKQGRLTFSWKLVRSWIKSDRLPPSSSHDSLVLELPLKVVAPLFLARKREASAEQQKVTVDSEIPNLFFGFPQPEAPAPQSQAVSKPMDTNYYIWDETSDTARLSIDEVKRSASPGTSLVAKCATPNEIVSRTAALDGVAGALIALPDGLMVASQVAADLNGDTLAAFLPQIFGKVTQCTKELRMGELNNLNFTVGNIPWKIFRVNAIFFAAFGRAGEALPTSKLAALAAELDHKPK